MDTPNPITPHQKKVAQLASDGWLTRKFSAFLTCLQFLEELTEELGRDIDGHERAHILFDRIQERKFTNLKALMPTVRRAAEQCGVSISTSEVRAEFEGFQHRGHTNIRLVPDAWRLGEPWVMSDGRRAAVIDVAEVGDSNPLFKDRLHKYALLDDAIQEYECGLALYEINATSGAVTEHDLTGMHVGASLALCRH